MKNANPLRRIFLALSLICIFSTAHAQYVAIPDSFFGKWLNTNGYSSCLTGNSTAGWHLDTTCTAVLSATNIDFSYADIPDFTGIMYFKNLGYFNCTGNHLTSLPTLPASLYYLNCNINALTSLPALPALSTLSCETNRITSLPALPPTLTNLDCYDNRLTSLPALPPTLAYLECSQNQINSLPALPPTLIHLQCSGNQLSSIPELFGSLTVFDCRYNTNISCVPRIYRNQLQQFFINGTNIHCLPNRFTASQYDVRPDTLPLCDPASGCDFYYNIAGTAHQDTAASCVSDSLYPGASLYNMKVQLSHNGQVQQQFYTFTSGVYSFKTDSLSTYQVSVDTTGLPLRVQCPIAGVRTIALTPADSVHPNENFGLSCAASADYGVLSMIGGRFRPGFATLITVTAGDAALLRYNASCGSGASGTVTTRLPGAVHYLNPALGALAPTSVAGSVLTYNVTNLDSLHIGSLDIVVTTDSNAAIGSQVCITTVISSSVPDVRPGDDTLTQCFTVVNSHDPNIKEVSPTAQSPNTSDWLTYTIHFQNTGSDTAYTVVVRDTLSANVMAESFQYLASSHKAVIQLMGNAMTFTFPHINLVDSATNPALSEGWIQYKVKSKSNLAIGTQVRNTAYIYFDANPAVVTNTAVTTIQLDTTTNINIGIHTVGTASTLSLYPNPNKGNFILQTTNCIHSDYQIYDMLGSLVASGTIATDLQAVDMPAIAEGVYTLLVRAVAQAKPVRFTITR